jgi:hypothetical protein
VRCGKLCRTPIERYQAVVSGIESGTYPNPYRAVSPVQDESSERESGQNNVGDEEKLVESSSKPSKREDGQEGVGEQSDDTLKSERYDCATHPIVNRHLHCRKGDTSRMP